MNDQIQVRPWVVIISIAVGFLILIPILNYGNKNFKQYDYELWKPWLSLKSSQIKMIKLEPVEGRCITLSQIADITDKKLILKLKLNLSRIPMDVKDRTGYHWYSDKKIRLTAITDGYQFSFILLFHVDFDSVRYQMSIYNSDQKKYNNVGEAWRSSELFHIINDYVNKNEQIYWVNHKTY